MKPDLRRGKRAKSSHHSKFFGTILGDNELIAKEIKRKFMLRWAGIFLVIAIVAAILGLGGLAGTATNIAYVIFIAFLILAVFAFIRRNA
jgi:uncharacterized membrane protein YtjA (UPF0391 family)